MVEQASNIGSRQSIVSNVLQSIACGRIVESVEAAKLPQHPENMSLSSDPRNYRALWIPACFLVVVRLRKDPGFL